MIYIDVINESTEASDKTIKWLLAALQKQIVRDFEPIWGYTATLIFIPKGVKPSPYHWQLIFLDNADQAGALGYHDLTQAGLPLGKVFIRTAEENQSAWSETASHEVLEMLGDPYANSATIVLSTNTTGIAYAYEVCDACEGEDYGYVINDFKVSNFVTPSWFNPDAALIQTTQKYDFMGHITKPLQLLPGGYIGIYKIPNTNGWEQSILGNLLKTKNRFTLRTTPYENRKLSTRCGCGCEL